MSYPKNAVTGQPLYNHALQEFNDCLAFSRESLESRDYFEILKRCSLAKRYLESDLSVILELCPKGNSLAVVVGARKNNVIAVDTAIFVMEFHALDADCCEHWDQEMVFVVDVERMDGTYIRVPSLVRFNTLNQKVEQGGAGIYLSCLRESAYKVLPIVAYGKFGVGGIEPIGTQDADCFAIGDVKSAMEIVDCVANNERNIRAQCVISQSVVKELFPRIAIDVQAGSVTLRRGLESLVNIRDMLIGPFEL